MLKAGRDARSDSSDSSDSNAACARVPRAQGGNEEALPVLERELAVVKGMAPTEAPPAPSSAPSALLQQVALCVCSPLRS